MHELMQWEEEGWKEEGWGGDEGGSMETQIAQNRSNKVLEAGI